MVLSRDASASERSTDSVFMRLLLPILVSAVTSFIGGAAGGYITIQIHEYRIGQLETHVKEDQMRFADKAARDAVVATELAAVHERHRMEDLARANGAGVVKP